MPRGYSTISVSDEDLKRIDEALALLEALYGFRPSSRAELVRMAVRDLLEAKRKEWEAKNRDGAPLRRPPGSSTGR